MKLLTAVFLLALALHTRLVVCQVTEALGADMVDMLLGEWVLEDVDVRVPTEANPAGISYMTGHTVDLKLIAIANDTELLSKDDMALNDELQSLVVTTDAPRFNESTFIIVASNAFSGATVGYNMFKAGNSTVWKRNMGKARKTPEGTVVWTAGEQAGPANWEFLFSQGAAGEWVLQATRLQPYQITQNSTVTERQAILVAGPYMKTNATLGELYPAIASSLGK